MYIASELLHWFLPAFSVSNDVSSPLSMYQWFWCIRTCILFTHKVKFVGISIPEFFSKEEYDIQKRSLPGLFIDFWVEVMDREAA